MYHILALIALMAGHSELDNIKESIKINKPALEKVLAGDSQNTTNKPKASDLELEQPTSKEASKLAEETTPTPLVKNSQQNKLQNLKDKVKKEESDLQQLVQADLEAFKEDEIKVIDTKDSSKDNNKKDIAAKNIDKDRNELSTDESSTSTVEKLKKESKKEVTKQLTQEEPIITKSLQNKDIEPKTNSKSEKLASKKDLTKLATKSEKSEKLEDKVTPTVLVKDSQIQDSQAGVLQALKNTIKKEEDDLRKVVQADLESLGLDIIDEPKDKIETTDDIQLNKDTDKKDKDVAIKDKQEEEQKTSITSTIAKIGTNIKTTVKAILSPKTKEEKIEIVKKDSQDNKKEAKDKLIEENIVKQKELKKNLKIAQEEELTRKLKRKEIIDEAKQKRKLQKLNELREKYLVKSDQEAQEEALEISKYQKMTKITPKKKILSKFVNYDVPPALLNRYRSYDNKHHPIIISYQEKIDLMFKAINENKTTDFNALFELVDQPNIKNLYGDTLLTYAVLMQKYGIISSLLSKGANPNMRNNLGYTPLNIAIELIDYKSASLLIDMGANINFVDELGRNYLIQAARVGSLPISELLVDKGIDMNLENANGSTALHTAHKYNKEIVAKFLISKGLERWKSGKYRKYRSRQSIIRELEGLRH